MTDKEKAKELALTLLGEDQNPEPIVEILMEMAQWKKQQMMKDAIKEKVVGLFGAEFIIIENPEDVEVGDNVKVIIIKEG